MMMIIQSMQYAVTKYRCAISNKINCGPKEKYLYYLLFYFAFYLSEKGQNKKGGLGRKRERKRLRLLTDDNVGNSPNGTTDAGVEHGDAWGRGGRTLRRTAHHDTWYMLEYQSTDISRSLDIWRQIIVYYVSNQPVQSETVLTRTAIHQNLVYWKLKMNKWVEVMTKKFLLCDACDQWVKFPHPRNVATWW